MSKVLTPCENLIYKVTRVDREEQMTWKKYAVSVMIFSGIGLVFLFLLQLLQGVLPGNPQHLSGVKWDLAFNTSASFITNTNWQAYSGESTLSYLTQALGLTVQNFVSAATGIAVLFALIRGFIKVKSSGLGSFWVDLTRIVVHILLPLNLVISLLLVGGGVIQNLKSAETVSLVEPIAVSAEGEILEDAVIDLDTETVTVDGEIVSDKKKYKVHRTACVQKKRVFLPGYRRSVTRNWRSAYEGCPDLGKEQFNAGGSCGLLRHWHQQTA